MALRVRKFEHEVDSLAGCVILVHEEVDDKVTHIVYSREDSEFETKALETAFKFLNNIIDAEVDRRASKIIRDSHVEGYPSWKKHNRKFKNATMRRHRALNRAIMWKAGTEE